MCSINHEAVKSSAAFRDLPLVGVQRFDDESYELRNCSECHTTLAVEEEVTVQMPDAKTLAAAVEAVHRSRVVRHLCDDCNDVTDEGLPAGPCPRHSQRCIGCGGDEIVEADAHAYEDGVSAFWCHNCIRSEIS